MGLNFTNNHERLAKPKQKIFVLGITGLTNFSGSTIKAHSMTLIEKFSAGVFCFFLTAKRKKTVRPGQKECSIDIKIKVFVSQMIF
ncbi:hypothetical protein [Pedobacter sp. KLB.chiD]|uniref:hypothetical protein n=1 Tax=Pedobacter sp. KLB.chiD TaxID=3387402 RepID=UPI00399BD035